MNAWFAEKMDIVLGHPLSSLFFRPGERHDTDRKTLEVYREDRFATDPASFFGQEPDPPTVTFCEPHATPAYICEPFSFSSPYVPLSDDFAQRYATYPETHVVHGRRYRPFIGPSRAKLLMLHGWTGGNFGWEERTLIRWLCRDCGITVVALTHPYHGPRKPAGARFSGEFFVSADGVRTIEASRQVVIDARAALSWLLCEGNEAVGIIGISLGAFMIYLLLGVDGRPVFALPMPGHGDLFDVPSQASLTKHIRRGYRDQGLDSETLSVFGLPLTARENRPKLAPERILPINGEYDTIVTSENAQRLFDAWKIPEVVWLPTGHFGIVHTRLFRRAFQDFVERWI